MKLPFTENIHHHHPSLWPSDTLDPSAILPNTHWSPYWPALDTRIEKNKNISVSVALFRNVDVACSGTVSQLCNGQIRWTENYYLYSVISPSTKKPYPCFETLSSKPLINIARTFGFEDFQRVSFSDIPTCHSDLAQLLFSAAVFQRWANVV